MYLLTVGYLYSEEWICEYIRKILRRNAETELHKASSIRFSYWFVSLITVAIPQVFLCLDTKKQLHISLFMTYGWSQTFVTVSCSMLQHYQVFEASQFHNKPNSGLHNRLNKSQNVSLNGYGCNLLWSISEYLYKFWTNFMKATILTSSLLRHGKGRVGKRPTYHFWEGKKI